jgi:hypothetical protein
MQNKRSKSVYEIFAPAFQEEDVILQSGQQDQFSTTTTHTHTSAPAASTPFLIDSLNVATCPYME